MKLIGYSIINQTGAYLNGKQVYARSNDDEKLLKSIYNQSEMPYPKFFKMDVLSKLAVLSAHLILQSVEKQSSFENHLQLIFANQNSSMSTDLKFIDSYKNQHKPSPSLFVYTLPNILIGELAIRYKWFGENNFFVMKSFDPVFFKQQISFAFNRGNKHCLCGWIDSTPKQNQCLLFLVSDEDGNENEIEELAENINASHQF